MKVPSQPHSRALLLDWLSHALHAVDGRERVRCALSGPAAAALAGDCAGVVVFAVGKAAARMTLGAYDALGPRLRRALVVTKAGNISRINPAVSHVTGWDSPALINRPLTELARPAPAPDGRAPLVADPIGRAMQDGRDLRDLPVLLRNRQGGEQAVLLTLFPVRDANKVVGGVITLRATAPVAHP